MFKSKVTAACFAAALALPVCISTAVAQDGRSNDMAAIRAAAEKGDPEAEFALSRTYLMGPRVPGDELKGLKLLQHSAQQGLAKAQGMLATLYFYGNGKIKKNESEAIKWALRASAQGDLMSDITLANIYIFGVQTKQDRDKAISYLRPAIEHHDGDAEGFLANIYLGVAGGDHDYGQALSWAEMAIKDGETFGDGKAALGAIYLFGLGVPQDYQKGMSYLNDNKSVFAAIYLANMQDNINKKDADIMQRLRSMPPMPMPTAPAPMSSFDQGGMRPTGESAILDHQETAGGNYMTCYYGTAGGYKFTTTSNSISCPLSVTVDPQSGRAW